MSAVPIVSHDEQQRAAIQVLRKQVEDLQRARVEYAASFRAEVDQLKQDNRGLLQVIIWLGAQLAVRSGVVEAAREAARHYGDGPLSLALAALDQAAGPDRVRMAQHPDEHVTVRWTVCEYGYKYEEPQPLYQGGPLQRSRRRSTLLNRYEGMRIETWGGSDDFGVKMTKPDGSRLESVESRYCHNWSMAGSRFEIDMASTQDDGDDFFGRVYVCAREGVRMAQFPSSDPT